MSAENFKKEPLGRGFEVFTSKNHTFGTDAVLLANFAKQKNTKHLIDLGCGCGIIPLLLFRENPPKSAVGVDIQDEACTLAKMGAEHNKISDKFTVICSDINELAGKTEFGAADLITCNPPYKKSGAGIKSSGASQLIARHETECDLEDIIRVGSKLLQTMGRFCICQRPERLADIIYLFKKYNIEPKRLRTVSKKAGCEPWLILIEGRKCANSSLRIMPPLFVYNANGTYTDEMLEIYSVYKQSQHITPLKSDSGAQ